VSLNKIAENESFENCVLKKLRFENAENYLFKLQENRRFFENAEFLRLTCDFKDQTAILSNT
jgi:hypothetical protein